MALVHFQTEGEITPNPKLLCDDRLATDGIRASGRQHPIQHRHADGSLGLLSRKAAGSQPWSDQRLVATHCRFYQGPLAVTGCGLPSQAALFRDHRQMAITLVGGPESPLGTAVERGGITTGTVSWLGVCSGNGITLWLIFTWV